ncbi:chlorophyll synthesis pathway protein BchC [Roseospira marina]|uniref:Chlorophyll synthesis pathway protein BchC n=1 Tax=Roseospira marina TaxID=140057 RepID=A0A5M6IB67_9PROT|nr:chlorophyll synthesis pathway protein BchC [Roseospira marina]KAA5605540.1 chlorophyll synthesis pathway protein BchC [Roseospira marina]MBB4313400.1 3-hydroxyethyl bacteriochlorophyllide a dehydrogenase [Roseospira marina]MBB5085859.1 3-hydroxyethyl bacteriochlorophyllide a dehydrogenase [Roseospira marina]
MQTDAIVIEQPERLSLTRLDLDPPADEDVVVDVEWSGISTGTERLLWTGRMPPFPGMGYPLVPGYESVGRIVVAGPASGRHEGDRVFVPGAKCYGPVRGLFGGAAARVVVPGSRVLPVAESLEERAVLLALAATARHALVPVEGAPLPELVVGHGVLGRLIARLTVAMGGPAPVVWERNPERASGALGYSVVDPADDDRRDYGVMCDVSGDGAILDSLIGRLAPGGEIVLAGFYEGSLAFDFVPAFLREVRMRVAAQWRPGDLEAVSALIDAGRLSLDGLITHRETVDRADQAYRAAFGDPSCLKMILDWRARA